MARKTRQRGSQRPQRSKQTRWADSERALFILTYESDPVPPFMITVK